MRLALTRRPRALVRWVLAALAAQLCVVPLQGVAVTVAVISDLNGSYGSTRYGAPVREAIAGIVALQADLVISTGDMVGGQQLRPLLRDDEIERMWRAFHQNVTDPIRAAGIPLAVTPGNHDASAYPSFHRERALYATEWRARESGLEFVDALDYPFHYAFARGDVLFVSLDVTRVGRLDSDQLRWLDGLLTVYGPRYRHRVVFSHLPIHAFTRGRETEVSGDLDLEAILVRHGVELYLSGHHHAFYPGYHGGVRYVGQACLGSGPRMLIGTHERSEPAVTWLQFDDGGVQITALKGPGLREQIDLRTLPPEIRGKTGTLVRDDLRPMSPGPAANGARQDR